MKKYANPKNELRVAFPYDKPASFYDPTRIFLSPEYTFLENIYSPLVENTPKGELVAAVAESFFWNGNDAVFKIRKELKTIDGYQISALDVEASLKRLFIITGNTHGNLKSLLCPEMEIKNLHDSCPNLVIEPETNTVTMKFKEKKVFLFAMLAAMDFAIIPKIAINPLTLGITDYRNTSGPFFVMKDSETGHIELAANPYHFNYSTYIPKTVKLIPVTATDPRTSVSMLNDDKIDMITTVDRAPAEDIIDYASRAENVLLHKTLNLRTFAISFTKQGMRKFSIEQRLKIGRIFRFVFQGMKSRSPAITVADELFPIYGEASLADEQKRTVSNLIKMSSAVDPERMTAWIIRMPEIDSSHHLLKKHLPNVLFQHQNKVPGFTDFIAEKIKEPDFIVCGPDMGFLENIGLLTHYTLADLFFFPNYISGEEWLKRYTEIPNKMDRLQLLRELHFNTIVSGKTIPLASAPYTAIVKTPWKSDLSKIQASDALWRVTQ